MVILRKGICVDDVIISLNRDGNGESWVKKKVSTPKMGSGGLIFEDLAELNPEEYRKYLSFDCPVPENADISYSVSDTLPDSSYMELEISVFVDNINLDRVRDIVLPEIDDISAEQWATGQMSVFLDDFLTGEEAENTGYAELVSEISESVLDAVKASCENNEADVVFDEELIVLDRENNDAEVIIIDGDDSEPEDEHLFKEINDYFEKFYQHVQYAIRVRSLMRS